ncbi:hypothetical protein [Aurantibacter crassamenti]|uniref:hypothetical protein n=1 Tax=Aurantibacter crassamenti TaxID=1837375 RepID=UPI001EEE90B8|nr:hypothetical protein [Aurantibacter crassamenti]
MNKTIEPLRLCVVLLFVLLLSSCSVTKPSSDAMYAEAWQKVLKSQAWKDALITETSEPEIESQEFYASNDDEMIIDDSYLKKSEVVPRFDIKYDKLVRTAYVRIIAQAEEADAQIEKEYILRNAVALDADKKKSQDFNQKLKQVNQRYHSHRKMLEGLKSWNIFSRYGTDDLEFFKDENQVEVQGMLQQGKGEAAVINFLIYKLADLYHF